MRRLVIVGVVALAAFGAAGLLAGCESADNAAARRADAEAELVRAQAAADSERAATRQMERDAAHQRTIDLLPYVVAIGGGLLLAGFGAFVAWDVRTNRAARPTAAEAAILLELRRLGELQAQQARRERAILRALTDRPALPNGRGEVIIYTDKQR